jgi:GT2 family glycosyltransferase
MSQKNPVCERAAIYVSHVPQVSILIVNFNGGEMLRNLLASIEQHRGPVTVEAIVVDNASSDHSAQLQPRAFPIVLIKNSANVGFARGNNQAASAANAPLLLLLNNDTLLRAGALERLLDFMDRHPDAVAAGPKLIGGDARPQRTARNLPTLPALLNSIQLLRWTGIFRPAYRNYRRRDFDPQQPTEIPQLAAAALVIRREAFEKIRGFDEGFPFGVEDVDLCRRLGQFGKIYYVPAAEIEHLGRASSRANRPFVYRSYECGWARYLRKHHGWGPAILYKSLVTADMPLRIAGLCLQWTIQRTLGKSEKADNTLSRLRAAWQFAARGLGAFWLWS